MQFTRQTPIHLLRREDWQRLHHGGVQERTLGVVLSISQSQHRRDTHSRRRVSVVTVYAHPFPEAFFISVKKIYGPWSVSGSHCLSVCGRSLSRPENWGLCPAVYEARVFGTSSFKLQHVL